MAKKSAVEYYKDKRGRWRWRARARNGNIVADSGEGYARKIGAERGARAAWRLLTAAASFGP